MSCFISRIAFCHPGMESHDNTTSSLLLWPFFPCENIKQLVSCTCTAATRPGHFSQWGQVCDRPLRPTDEPNIKALPLQGASTNLSLANIFLKQSPLLCRMCKRNLSLPTPGPAPHDRTLSSKCKYPRWGYVLFKAKAWPQLLSQIWILKVGRKTPKTHALSTYQNRGKSLHRWRKRWNESNSQLSLYDLGQVASPLGILFFLPLPV